ncbi:MAG: hypothetical protein CTY33_02855 [Methylotenera sp.]|nr:MAG: hypothetical protein CTY33_02855 [Methylotenera sp.]
MEITFNKFKNKDYVFDWVSSSFHSEEGFYIVALTLTGRIRFNSLSSKTIILINEQSLSEKQVGRSFTFPELESGFNEFMKQLDYKYLPTSKRKKGIRLKVLPCYGGDVKNGSFNHVHAYIRFPNSVSLENAYLYMEKIVQNKMEGVCKLRGLVETKIWCEKVDKVEPKLIQYMTRSEGEFKNKLDKIMLHQAYL